MIKYLPSVYCAVNVESGLSERFVRCVVKVLRLINLSNSSLLLSYDAKSDKRIGKHLLEDNLSEGGIVNLRWSWSKMPQLVADMPFCHFVFFSESENDILTQKMLWILTLAFYSHPATRSSIPDRLC